MLKYTSLIASVVVIFFACSLSSAHEFWIEPGWFSGGPGDLFTARLMHGERFDGDVVRRDEPQIRRFEFVGNGHETVGLIGRHQSEVSYARLDGSGVVVYESEQYVNDLPAERFNAYLEEEVLESAQREREERGESGEVGREVYSRCAKSIISIEGDMANADAIDRVVGLPLEILVESVVAEQSEDDGDVKRVCASVQFLGEPMAGLRVVVARRSDPDSLVELQTDGHGRIVFDVLGGDDLMITTIYIRRAEDIETTEWESFWASSTFEVR